MPHFAMPLEHYIEHALVLVGELVLIQLAHAQSRFEHDLAARLLELAAQDLHERGLAAAIGTDEPIAVTVTELDRDVLEQRLGAELDGYVGRRKHVRSEPAAAICSEVDGWTLGDA